MTCKHKHACLFDNVVWWCHECGAIAKHWKGRRGRPSTGSWTLPHSEKGQDSLAEEISRLTIKALKLELEQLRPKAESEGTLIETLAEEKPESEACLEPAERWWPQQVKCLLCGEMIRLGDQEPDCYLAECPCGGLGIIRPK